MYIISSQRCKTDGTVSSKLHFTLNRFLLREAVAKFPWPVAGFDTLSRSPLVWKVVTSVHSEPDGSAPNSSPTFLYCVIWDKPLNVGLNFFICRIMAIALSVSQGS